MEGRTGVACHVSRVAVVARGLSRTVENRGNARRSPMTVAAGKSRCAGHDVHSTMTETGNAIYRDQIDSPSFNFILKQL